MWVRHVCGPLAQPPWELLAQPLEQAGVRVGGALCAAGLTVGRLYLQMPQPRLFWGDDLTVLCPTPRHLSPASGMFLSVSKKSLLWPKRLSLCVECALPSLVPYLVPVHHPPVPTPPWPCLSPALWPLHLLPFLSAGLHPSNLYG